LKNYSALSKAAETAWGKGYYTDDITRQFRENLLRFSGAKSNDLMMRLDDLRSNSKDKESFIEEAKKMVALHNETYLNVEQKFAANSTSTAKNFEQFIADADIYPCLTNRTMGDANVRDTHAENEGVTKRVEDWNETPPYDAGCRCWLEQTTDEPTKNGLVNLDSKWANNPYTSGCIFTEKHSYFESIPDNSIQAVRENSELMKQYIPYNQTIETEGGNKVLVNDFVDTYDMNENIDAAKKVADEIGKDMYIRYHIDGGIVKGFKNPEYGIGSPNTLGDLKTYKGKSKFDNFMQNNIKKADKQGATYVVIDVTKAKFSDDYMKNRLSGSLTGDRNSNIERIILIKGDKVSQITRKQIANNDFITLNKLNKK